MDEVLAKGTLTVAEVAGMLGWGRTRVYELIHDGTLRSIGSKRNGRLSGVRIPKAWLEEDLKKLVVA